MATTTGGSTYVTSTDLVANYPTASLALANRVDVVASGSMSKKTASYTVTVADILAGTTICMNSASATVITLPSTSLVNGMQVNVFSVNTGAVTFTGGTVTGTSTSITAQYSGLSLTWDSAASVWWCLPFGGGSAKAAVSSTTGSPATGNVTYSGTTWDYWKWTATGTVTTSVSGLCDIVVVGGGGGGGTNGNFGGGKGGGGAVVSKRIWLPAGTYSVQVGATASIGAGGNGSLFDQYLGIGGGAGGYGGSGGGGGSGGSGASGGGGGYEGGPSAGGAALYNGAFGYAGQNGNYGWGGGAGGASSTSASGPGLTVWAGTFGAGGTGSAGGANTGNGGVNNTTGGSGVVWLGVAR